MVKAVKSMNCINISIDKTGQVDPRKKEVVLRQRSIRRFIRFYKPVRKEDPDPSIHFIDYPFQYQSSRMIFSTKEHAMFKFNSLRKLVRREEGQTLSEYALILVLIAVVAIVAITLLGNQISAVINSIANAL
jgi:pilus assembly protein Flp/PilA